MKKLIEKVKSNKIKSFGIILSSFLVGFLVVNLFTNITQNTYAVQYTCSNGWYLTDATKGKCCPTSEFLLYDINTCQVILSKTITEQKCKGYGGVWLAGAQKCSVPSKNATVSTATKKCYQCGSTYYWATSPPSSSGCVYLSGVTQNNCSAAKQQKKCYQCGSTYYWATSPPSSSGCVYLSGVTQNNCSASKQQKCYRCSDPYGGWYYTWATSPPSSSGCTWNRNITSQSGCQVKHLQASFIATNNGAVVANNGTVPSTIQSCTVEPGNTSCKVTAPSAKRDGYNFAGWSTQQNCPSGTGFASGTISINSNKIYYTCWSTSKATKEDYNDYPTYDSGSSSSSPSVTANTRNFYTITYDLDGGHFIDNTTSRTEVVASNKKIGNLKTNPLKDGKKFVEWQADGKTFDFSQMPTKNVTVKAIYEDLTDEDKQYYCEDSNYVLDPSKRLCYKVMVPDNKKTFNYTTYTYAENSRFCYAYHSDTGTPGGVYYKTGQNVPDEEKGKQGEEYEGYNKQEAWISKDTCQIASECKKSSSESYSACEIRWDAIIYTTTNALVKEEEDKFVEVPDDEPADDDENKEDNDSSNKENNNKTDKDLTSSPKTGSFLIIFAWVVGIGALIAAVYILKKNSNKVEKDN